MKPRRVMIDIDGCLADFIRGYTRTGARMFPGIMREQETIDRDKWHELDSPEDDSIWSFIKNSGDWWEHLEPLITAECFEHINALSRSDEVYFVTARVGVGVKRQTERWLSRRGITSPTVIISAKKGEIAQAIGATHCLDDKAGNAVAVTYLSRGTESYLLDRKYNRLDPTVIGDRVKRVGSVRAFLDAIDGRAFEVEVVV